MASADFSQFVVTTANETACEISPVKVRTLSLHVPAAFTRTSSNFWTSVSFATLSVFPSLLCGSCPSGQRFAYSFFQIPPRDGHPCCSAMCFVVAYAHSGLSPVRERPCWANKTTSEIEDFRCSRLITTKVILSQQGIHCPAGTAALHLLQLRENGRFPRRNGYPHGHRSPWKLSLIHI